MANALAIQPGPGDVSWVTPYLRGDEIPARQDPPAGTYTPQGLIPGHADVTAAEKGDGHGLGSVTYHQYSEDPAAIITGNENVTTSSPSLASSYSNLTSCGLTNSFELTSPDWFHLLMDLLETNFDANGTLTTTIGGVEYTQPLNDT
ncbi:hypothetical protein N7508_003628 [Penicillium antarcticum]|uniref:uncharacterized protein n=1 Tax=Penicillium antarcticum TaxID=416450 RepID=UPI00238A68C7|nr:uncharacterized protein N7508_003628 [Penicillium antarcticum]KAJ5312798.1 hypothetical protein N7508_003628 [Penicillium antarcticum]